MSATLSPQASAEGQTAAPRDHRKEPRKSRYEKWLLGTSACELIEVPYPTLVRLRESGLVRTRQLPTERSPRYCREDLERIARESVKQGHFAGTDADAPTQGQPAA